MKHHFKRLSYSLAKQHFCRPKWLFWKYRPWNPPWKTFELNNDGQTCPNGGYSAPKQNTPAHDVVLLALGLVGIWPTSWGRRCTCPHGRRWWWFVHLYFTISGGNKMFLLPHKQLVWSDWVPQIKDDHSFHSVTLNLQACAHTHTLSLSLARSVLYAHKWRTVRMSQVVLII